MYGKSGTKSRKTGRLNSINPSDYSQIVFFTGAGISMVSTHIFDVKIYKPSSTALMELFSENY
jgi:hypothetical protein